MAEGTAVEAKLASLGYGGGFGEEEDDEFNDAKEEEWGRRGLRDATDRRRPYQSWW